MRLYNILLLLFILGAGCELSKVSPTYNSEASNAMASGTPGSEVAASKANSVSAAASLVVFNKRGDTVDIQGFKLSDVMRGGNEISIDDLMSDSVQGKSLFEFKQPDGFSASFSAPVLGGESNAQSSDGHSLLLEDPLGYRLTPPSFGEVLQLAQQSTLCGLLNIKLKIRLVPNELRPGDKNQELLINTPALKISIPCQRESIAAVDVAAMDRMERDQIVESNKQQETVKKDDRDDEAVQKGASIVINDDNVYATDLAVSLTLSTKKAIAMFVTRVPGCRSGGAWEPYVKSKPWTLGRANAVNNVYAVFRNEAGKLSDCVSDTIIHDSERPHDAGIVVNKGAGFTSSTLVSLALVAGGAAEMYVTNSELCQAGGAWEPYAVSKSGWKLSQANATAMVYVKYRDLAGNETPCISDSIIHDSIEPSEPANVDDGISTSLVSLAPEISWRSSIDNGSGLTRYEVALGTRPGLADVKDWTDVGVTNSVSLVGLELQTAAYYHASVRAIDKAGNRSQVAKGDGFMVRPDGNWKQQAYIKSANADARDGFGGSVSIDGDVLAVSAPYESSNQSTVTNGPTASSDNSKADSGAAFVYRRSAEAWSQEAYLKASNSRANASFGWPVKVSGDFIAAGSYGESGNQSTITNGSTASTDSSKRSSGAVYMFSRAAGTWAQEAYIKADGNREDLQFGGALALSGDTLVVGVQMDESSQSTITNGSGAGQDRSLRYAGAAYVYKRSAGAWAQEAYIKPGNVDVDFGFGHAVALEGNTLAIGAYHEDGASTTVINGTGFGEKSYQHGSGATYIYKRTASTWRQEAYLKASNAEFGDAFGVGVALSGDSLAVAAYAEASSQRSISQGTIASPDNSYEQAGAIYMFKRSASSWAQEAYIKAGNNKPRLLFGLNLDLKANTLAVGAPLESGVQTTITNGPQTGLNEGKERSGAAYVYKRVASAWSPDAYIKASNGDAIDDFGTSVALSGNTLVVAAPYEDSAQASITNGTTASTDNTKTNSGAVYVFTRE